MQGKNMEFASKNDESVKKLRVIGVLVFIGILHAMNLAGVFSPTVIVMIEVNYCILLLVALLTPSSSHLFKHAAIILRCIIIPSAFYVDPTNHMICFIITLMNGFYIGMEIDSAFYRILYSFCSLSPWAITVAFPEIFHLSPEQVADSIRTGCCALFIFVFVFITSAINRNARLDALNKLEKAYDELREMNVKNEEMNRNLKQLLEDKDNFILLFSHETRNPLNILLGNLALLLEEVDAPHLRTKLLRSRFCAELLLHHLNNILDTGKLTNKNVLEVTSVRIKTQEYLQSIWDFMEMLLKKKGLKAELVISRRIPKHLMFDPQRLTQILLNLLSNAAKFTTHGSVSLNVSYLNKPLLDEVDYLPTTIFGSKLAKRDPEHIINNEGDLQEFSLETQNVYMKEFQRKVLGSIDSYMLEEELNQDKGYLKFEISDTGCGIKVEDLQNLFKKFNQVHSEGSQRQIGSGLGLWISKNLSQLMDGDIRVHSKPNLGTCFVLIIETKNSFTAASRPEDTRLSTFSCRKEDQSRKILLADDDPHNLDVHKRLLKNIGWENLVTATDGRELVNLFQTHPSGTFYAVITDINMPILDGISAAKLIREIENKRGAKTSVKIGFITGHPNHSDKLICQQQPINGWFYISKPVTVAILEGYFQTKNSLGRKNSNKKELRTKENKFVVLCVDDDLFNLEMLEGMLAEFNTVVIKAQSGKLALEIVKAEMEQKRRIDLVFMDSNMPEMDGWETSTKIKEITQKNELNKEMTIIGLSGDKLSSHDKEKLKKSAIRDWIQKPIRREDLLNIFQKLNEKLI